MATSNQSPLYNDPPNYNDPAQPTPSAPVVLPQQFTLPTYTQQPYGASALPKPAAGPPVHPLVAALSAITRGQAPQPGQQRFAQAAFPSRSRVDPIRILLQALRAPH